MTDLIFTSGGFTLNDPDDFISRYAKLISFRLIFVQFQFYYHT